jgi:hypothetical protein
MCSSIPFHVLCVLRAGLRAWVDSHRRGVSVLSGALLSLVPWMQVRGKHTHATCRTHAWCCAGTADPRLQHELQSLLFQPF